MTTRAVERIDEWESEPFPGGYRPLHDLAAEEFSGVVTAGGAKLCLLTGTVVGVLDGTLESFEDTAGTVYEAPSPAIPVLALMQERNDEVKAKYYSEDTPISEVDSKLTDAGFSGYIELSENVLSGDYYLVYHAGQSMAVAWVGNSKQLLTDDEAFERADGEVGIYQVRPAEIEPIEVPEAEPSPDSGVAAATADQAAEAGGEATDTEATDAEATDAEATDTEADAGATDAEATDAEADATADAGGETVTDDAGRESAAVESRRPDERGDAGAGTEPDADTRDTGGAANGGTAKSGPGSGRTATGRSAPGTGAGGRTQAGSNSRAGGAGSGPSGGADQLETHSIPSLDPSRSVSPRDERTAVASPDSSGDEAPGAGAGPGAETGRQFGPGPGAEGDRTATGDSRAVSSAGETGPSAAETTRPAESADASGRGGRSTDATGGTGEAGSGGGGTRGTGGGTGHATSGADGRIADLEEELAEASAELEDVEAELAEVETERDSLQTERDELRDERDELRAERDRLRSDLDDLRHERDDVAAERDELRAEVEELESEVETLQSRLEQLETEFGATSDAEQRITPMEALDGADIFVRYESKGKATLETARDGSASRDQVNKNLQLEYHTQFDAAATAVSGQSFDAYLSETIQYRFITWLIEHLLYEIRDTGKVAALRDLYDAIPQIDRAELNGTVSAEFTEDGQDRRIEESFDIVLRDRMGNPLFVANLNDSRQAATETMMNSLVTAASHVGESAESLAAAFLVTSSFFEPEALETAAESTSGGLLSRDKRESFVKLSRKQGYHLCLVEAREGKFHLAVPEL